MNPLAQPLRRMIELASRLSDSMQAILGKTHPDTQTEITEAQAALSESEKRALVADDVWTRPLIAEAKPDSGQVDVLAGEPIYARDTKEYWRDRYFERRAVIGKWHARAVELGFDGVNDALESVSHPPKDAAQGFGEVVLHQVRFRPDDPRTDWQSCHAENFSHFVAHPEYATRELTVRQPIPENIRVDAEWLSRCLPAESMQLTFAVRIRNWLRSVSA